jgi:hypothetical protein
MKTFYYWMLGNFGFDPRRFFSFFINFPRFVSEYFKIKKLYKGKVSFVPYLNDRTSGAGDFMHEYFIQDVFAAQLVHDLNPKKVVDVGSRIDGYIGHLISFRPVELIDIRPVSSNTKNLSFLQLNFSDYASVQANYTDFVSCLHSIEHFGLGRYGDPISMDAVPSALKSFSKILQPDGHFLLSTTFGKERIVFNKQWIFSLQTILGHLAQVGFQIEQLFHLETTHFVQSTIETIETICKQRDVLVILLCRKA